MTSILSDYFYFFKNCAQIIILEKNTQLLKVCYNKKKSKVFFREKNIGKMFLLNLIFK